MNSGNDPLDDRAPDLGVMRGAFGWEPVSDDEAARRIYELVDAMTSIDLAAPAVFALPDHITVEPKAALKVARRLPPHVTYDPETLARAARFWQLQDQPAPGETMADSDKQETTTRAADDPRVPHHHHDGHGVAGARMVDASPERLRAASEQGRNARTTDRRATDFFGFELALRYLREGEKVARRGWNGRGQYIEMQSPDLRSKMTMPYLFIRTVDGSLVPWVASQTDLLGYDWCLVTERTVLQYGCDD